MVTEIVDLDLGTNSSFKIITMQGDVASRFIEFHLTYNNETFDLTGKTVSCRYSKDDKTVNTTSLVINDKLNGICTLDVPYELMKNPYVTRSELVIKQSNETLSTIPFTVEVVKSLVKSSVVESSSEFGALNDALWKVDGLDSKIKDLSSQLDNNVQEMKNNYAKKSEVNTLANDKADKITVEALNTKINALRESRPSGVYDNLEALKQAHPTDDGKMYIAGTKWCYHNGTSWVEGGEYQGKVIGDGSILKTHIADGEIDQQRLKRPWGNIYNPSSITIDLKNKTVRVNANPLYVFSGGNDYVQCADYNTVLDITEQIANMQTYYWTLMLVVDLSLPQSNRLKVIYGQTECKNCITLAIITNAGVIGNELGINVINSQGNEVYRSFERQYTPITIPDTFKKKQWEDKNIMVLGDSITETEIGWVQRFKQIIKPKTWTNLAVGGAKWCNEDNTIIDGSTNGENNVISNQVYKAINGNYPIPDIIIISASANDWRPTNEDIEKQFTNGTNTYIPLSSIDLKTWSGAIRYAVEKLTTKWLNAQIFICTPNQASQNIKEYTSIRDKGKIIKDVCHRLAIPVLDVGGECGICGLYENNDGSNGRYLWDGLHENSNGAYKHGEYIAKQIASRYVQYNYNVDEYDI